MCDVDAVRVLVDEGPHRVNELIALGAMFDRDMHGQLELAREGGHTLPRIVHAGGSATGAEVERALVEAVQATMAAIHEHAFALELIVEAGRCRGVLARFPDGTVQEVRATNVLVTTGGAGQLYAVTTNPLEATGDGIAMALRAGVAVADIEFTQFHPTALSIDSMPRPLLTEALRGHGALLRDTTGERFVDEMQPRDVVSRARPDGCSSSASTTCSSTPPAWSRSTSASRTSPRSSAGSASIPPRTGCRSPRPRTTRAVASSPTSRGSSSLPGLWAAGEASCSGVHGANRLASNSLLEGMVFGPRAVEAIEAGASGPEATGAMRTVLGMDPDLPDSVPSGVIGGRFVHLEPVAAAEHEAPQDPASLRSHLQHELTAHAGVLRDAASLEQAAKVVAGALAAPRSDTVADHELRNLATVAQAAVDAAQRREESRGAHTREDFPETSAAFAHRIVYV